MAGVTCVGLAPAVETAIRAALAGVEVPVVVASAGPQPRGAFLDCSQEEWAAAVAAAKAAFQAAQRAAAAWEEDGVGGRIVFLVPASTARVVPGDALAAAAGGFLTTIGQVGAIELGGKGITVNTVVHGWLEGEPEGLLEGIPAGRLATPADVAGAVAFLASPAAAYVNGATLTVDGGASITKSGGGSPLLP